MYGDENITEEEKQMRKFNAYRDLFLSLLAGQWRWMVIAGALTLAAVIAVMDWQVSSSSNRYAARTILLYNPQSNEYLKSLDIKQVAALCGKRAVVDAAAEKLSLSPEARRGLFRRVAVDVVKNRQSEISVSAAAGTARDAVALVNAIAAECVEMYGDFRREAVDTELTAMILQKQSLEMAVAEADRRQQELSRDLTYLTPQQEIERRRAIISNQMFAVSDLNVQIANEEAKIAELETQLQGIDQNALKYVPQLKNFLKEEERLGRELAKLRQVFTDKNPKVISAQAELAALNEDYQRFLAEKKITRYEPENIPVAGALNDDLRLARQKLGMLRASRTSLTAELEKNQGIVDRIVTMLPEYSELLRQREANLALLAGSDAKATGLKLLRDKAPGDLKPIEDAVSAVAQEELGGKKIAIALLAALCIAGFVGIYRTMALIICGPVGRNGELENHDELRWLGHYARIHVSAEQKKHEQGKIYYKMQESMHGRKTLFECVLPGAVDAAAINDALIWNAGMNGAKVFQLFIMDDQNPEMPSAFDDSDQLMAVLPTGNKGYMTIENVHSLSPAEIELLRNDVAVLLRTYEVVVISRCEKLGGEELFFRQMLDFCDCSLLFFGAGATRRKFLRYAAARQQETGKPMMAVMTGI